MHPPTGSFRKLPDIARVCLILAAVACGIILLLPVSLVIAVHTYGVWYGVGDVDQAKAQIKDATTKAEVRALLGPPHLTRGGGDEEQWDYWNNYLTSGSTLRIHFGPDERVTHSECWGN